MIIFSEVHWICLLLGKIYLHFFHVQPFILIRNHNGTQLIKITRRILSFFYSFSVSDCHSSRAKIRDNFLGLSALQNLKSSLFDYVVNTLRVGAIFRYLRRSLCVGLGVGLTQHVSSQPSLNCFMKKSKNTWDSWVGFYSMLQGKWSRMNK